MKYKQKFLTLRAKAQRGGTFDANGRHKPGTSYEDDPDEFGQLPTPWEGPLIDKFGQTSHEIALPKLPQRECDELDKNIKSIELNVGQLEEKYKQWYEFIAKQNGNIESITIKGRQNLERLRRISDELGKLKNATNAKAIEELHTAITAIINQYSIIDADIQTYKPIDNAIVTKDIELMLKNLSKAIKEKLNKLKTLTEKHRASCPQ
jgi:hypothetical protein